MGSTRPLHAMDEAAAAITRLKAIDMTVSGLVQGVGFRYFAQASAQRAGVVGWVRNTEDGSVEIHVEGTAERLAQFIQAIRRGPTHSQVDNVALTWQPATGQFHSFHIRD